jgi:surface protein
MDISYMFSNCVSLCSLPDITNWNTKNIMYINEIFSGCLSLSDYPDISKWKLDNIEPFNITNFEVINCDKVSIDKFEHLLNIFDQKNNNKENIINQNELSDKKIQKIYQEFGDSYDIHEINYDEIRIKIMKFKGNVKLIQNFLENNIKE